MQGIPRMDLNQQRLRTADENAARHAQGMLGAGSTPADVASAVAIACEREGDARAENVAALVMAARNAGTAQMPRAVAFFRF